MMKLQRKTVFLLFPVLFALACTREGTATQEEPREATTLEFPVLLEQPDGETRVDVNGSTGRVSWTEGDTVGIYVEDSQDNASGYRETPVVQNVETGYRKVTVPLNVYESLTGYAVYPYTAAYGDDSSPMVKYPVSYDLTGQEVSGVSSKTYVPVPMMAVNGEETLKFYHVGSIVRLNLANVPAAAAEIEVTFIGMQHVTGVCRVLNPGTANATTEIFSGLGNKVSFTGFTPDADGNLSLNIPVPTGDYSALSDIQIIARDASETVVGQVAKNIHRPYPNDFNWGELKHAYGRLVPADFTAGGLLDHVTLDAGEATIWLNKTVSRVPTAYYEDGKRAGSIEYSWESSDYAVASVSDAGVVRGVGPGEATITVTATSPFDGRTATASYTVYVNEITAISLAVSGTVIYKQDDYTPAGTATLTATVSHTNYGTIRSYPDDALIWTSSMPEYISVGGEVLGQPGAGEGEITAVATGSTLGGNSVLTAQINPLYIKSTSAVKASQTVYCKTKTVVVTPGTTIRGYTVSKGVLFQTKDTDAWGLTEGENPFELLDFYDQEQAGGGTKYYFTYGDISTKFGPGPSNSNLDYRFGKLVVEGDTWILPTKDIAERLVTRSEEEPGATIINDAGPQGVKHFARVSVNLSGTPYEGHPNKVGAILFPDGATITTNMKSFDTSSTNYVRFDEVLTLVEGGCIFLCGTGSLSGTTWGSGDAKYWTSTYGWNTWFSYAILFSLSTAEGGGSNEAGVGGGYVTLAMPVRMVKEN